MRTRASGVESKQPTRQLRLTMIVRLVVNDVVYVRGYM